MCYRAVIKKAALVVVTKVILTAVHPSTFQTFFMSTQISTFMYICPFHYVPLSAVDELLISPVTILLSYSTHNAEKETGFIIALFLKCVPLSLDFLNFLQGCMKGVLKWPQGQDINLHPDGMVLHKFQINWRREPQSSGVNFLYQKSVLPTGFGIRNYMFTKR